MKKAFLTMLSLLVFAAASFAQSNTGRLVGTVSDPSGVIPGATVVVTDNKTGKERTVVASDDGSFAVPQLEAGTYTVRVSAPGHKTFSANEVKIDTGRDYSLNAVMEVGDVSATVEVTAGADILNATTAEISNTVSPRQIQELPLNGRNPLSLIQLQAGTASNGAQNTSINGQRPSATNITRDGLNIQDNFIRTNAADFTQQTPSVDDVAEFTVTTQNAGAEQGYGASQVQLTTPRGENEFHGAIYEYNRNSKFGANRFFNNAQGVYAPNDPLVVAGLQQAGAPRSPRTFRNFNQFGGRLAGPIMKNKLFFFFNYEGLRDRQSQSTLRTVLTQNARQGIFTYRATCTTGCPAGITNGQLVSVNLFNIPITGGPTGINPIIQSRFLANIPLGNSIESGDQRNTTGYRFNQLANDDRNSFTTRLDYDINDRNTINAVYNWQKENQLIPDFGDNNGFTQVPAAAAISPNDFYVVAWRTTPNANLTNEVRAGYVRNFPQFPTTQPQQPNQFSQTNIAAGLLAGFITNPESTFLFQGRKTKTWTFQDNAEYMYGNHSFRFGAQFNVFRTLRLNAGGVLPTYVLSVGINTPQISASQFTNAALFPGGVSTTDRTTANNLYALLGGIISAESQTFNVVDRESGFVPGEGFRQDYAYENYNFYFSDQWRVSPKLTLNLGLRYEVWPAVRERNGVLTEVIIPEGTDPRAALLNPAGGLQAIGGNAGGGGRLFKTDKNNFAPVVSFAYAPNFKNSFMNMLFPGEGRTVLRGGYRISYFNDEFLKGSSGEGDQNSGLRENAARSNLNERVGAEGTIATPTVLLPRTFVQNNARLGSLGSIVTVDPNIQVPMNHEYNFGIQREIGWQTALEVRYVGAFSSNGTRYTDVNPVDIFNNGFLNDYLIARNNLAINEAERQRQIAAGQTPIASSAAYNPALAGSQPLTVFNNLGVLSSTFGGIGAAPGQILPSGATAPSTGVAGNATVLANLTGGTPGQLAITYAASFLSGTVPLLQNPNVGLAGFLTNSARYNYNGLQIELRRRFAGGLYFQANYTLQKTLTNSPGTDQRRFEFQVDPRFDEFEYGRATYDQTHIFNFNSIYEFPFGKGKHFFGDATGLLNHLVGGWQFNSIVRIASGAPFAILDPRGTASTNARSARMTANSSLTKEEIEGLTGVFRTANGVFFIDPSVIDPTTGRAANGIGSPTFNGQVFFNVPPGQYGQLERNFLNGPSYFNIDASLFKNIQITERVRLQLRVEAFNLFNHTNFGITATQQSQSINSANFGRLTTTFAPRVVQLAGRIEF